MNYKTKQQRLIAISDAYCKLHGKTSFTVNEVSEWAIANTLYPVPKRGDPVPECLAWEAWLEKAKATCDLTAQQLHDLMSPLFQREPELRPVYLYPDGLLWTIRKQPDGEIVWLPVDADPSKSSGMTNVIAQHFRDACVYSMVRKLKKWCDIVMGEGGEPKYLQTHTFVEIVGGLNDDRAIFYAPTLVEALVSACTAVFDNKHTEQSA